MRQRNCLRSRGAGRLTTAATANSRGTRIPTTKGAIPQVSYAIGGGGLRIFSPTDVSVDRL